jgi:DNA invertase Pin-like site-specific DNA recombinase
MAEGKFIAYYRVSTDRQGRSGLGLDAQRKAVADYLNGGSWTVAAEFTEIESGSRDDRPQLARAIAASRLYGAKLVIAKLDRLSRDVHFLTGLEKSGVRFVAADMPEANEMVVHMMAVVAQAERKMISARTKAALAAAKARGQKLGGDRGKRTAFTADTNGAGRIARMANANNRIAQLAPTIADLREQGVTSLGALARALTERGIPTARGSADWTPMQVSRVLARLPNAGCPARRPHGRKLVEGRESCRAALEVTVQVSEKAKAGQLSGDVMVFPDIALRGSLCLPAPTRNIRRFGRTSRTPPPGARRPWLLNGTASQAPMRAGAFRYWISSSPRHYPRRICGNRADRRSRPMPSQTLPRHVGVCAAPDLIMPAGEQKNSGPSHSPFQIEQRGCLAGPRISERRKKERALRMAVRGSHPFLESHNDPEVASCSSGKPEPERSRQRSCRFG